MLKIKDNVDLKELDKIYDLDTEVDLVEKVDE